MDELQDEVDYVELWGRVSVVHDVAAHRCVDEQCLLSCPNHARALTKRMPPPTTAPHHMPEVLCLERGCDALLAEMREHDNGDSDDTGDGRDDEEEVASRILVPSPSAFALAMVGDIMLQHEFIPMPQSGLARHECAQAYRNKFGDQPRWVLLHIALAMVLTDKSLNYDVVMVADCAYLLRKVHTPRPTYVQHVYVPSHTILPKLEPVCLTSHIHRVSCTGWAASTTRSASPPAAQWGAQES